MEGQATIGNKNKITLIIPIDINWDDSPELVRYSNEIDEMLKSPNYVNNSYQGLNRIICPDINNLDFNLLEVFKDVIVRGRNRYMSLRDLYNDMDDGGGYTHRRICPEHDLVRLFRAGSFEMKILLNYLHQNGGIHGVLKETFIDVSPLKDAIRYVNKYVKESLSWKWISVDDENIIIKLWTDSDEDYHELSFCATIKLPIAGDHINYISINFLLNKLFSRIQKELENEEVLTTNNDK